MQEKLCRGEMDRFVQLRHTSLMAKEQRPTYKPLEIEAWLEWTNHSQRELAEAIGYSESHVSLVVSGGRPYNQAIKDACALFFGIPPAWLHYKPSDLPLDARYAELTPTERERVNAFLDGLLASQKPSK